MVIGIPSVPGFWPDYYVCWSKERDIIDTLIRMIKHSASDFPNTTLCDVKIVGGEVTRIYPVVMREDLTIRDFSPAEEKE